MSILLVVPRTTEVSGPQITEDCFAFARYFANHECSSSLFYKAVPHRVLKGRMSMYLHKFSIEGKYVPGSGSVQKTDQLNELQGLSHLSPSKSLKSPRVN